MQQLKEDRKVSHSNKTNAVCTSIINIQITDNLKLITSEINKK